MEPANLRERDFAHYPPQARSVADAHLAVLRRIPVSLLPLILRQLIKYDWLFPPEQRELTGQLKALESLTPGEFDALMAPFAAIRLPASLSGSDWLNRPDEFSDQLSAFLWSAHQIDGYHAAGRAFQSKMEALAAPQQLMTARYVMVAIGAGVNKTDQSLFRRLAPHGTVFTNVDSADGVGVLLQAVKERAGRYPASFAHWYIDGGKPHPAAAADDGVSVMSYWGLAPAIHRELGLLSSYMEQPPQTTSTQVEATTAYMSEIETKQLGMTSGSALEHFARDVLTEGSGTQVYSTTFVQWSARECLRRAQPLTLFARFQPRQQAAAMNQLLARDPFAQQVDVEGSLLDADMGAYLTWVNETRLPGADASRFLAWFEDHDLAVAIGPSMARGASSAGPATLDKILDWMA